MNIWIDRSAFKGPEDHLLWPGALFGLMHLRQLGHTVSFNADELNETRRQLLANESIEPAMFSREGSELIVISSGGLEARDISGDMLAEADTWVELSNQICFPSRQAILDRQTAETDISLSINLDGQGTASIDTGLKFFDHMLDQIAKHGLIDLDLSCRGDLEVDEHHTIEDVAIAFGEAIDRALGSKTGIQRYGFVLPMDESRATVALDLSGRPYLKFEGSFDREYVGDFPTEMAEHFFYSLAINLKATLHVSVVGQNDHHKIESCFKGLARCLRACVSRSERNLNILPSTKNLL